MKKLVFVIMARKGGPRMNASSANQVRGQKKWSTVQGSIPRSSVGMDGHCKNIGQGEVLKYLRRKLLPPH